MVGHYWVVCCPMAREKSTPQHTRPTSSRSLPLSIHPHMLTVHHSAAPNSLLPSPLCPAPSSLLPRACCCRPSKVPLGRAALLQAWCRPSCPCTLPPPSPSPPTPPTPPSWQPCARLGPAPCPWSSLLVGCVTLCDWTPPPFPHSWCRARLVPGLSVLLAPLFSTLVYRAVVCVCPLTAVQKFLEGALPGRVCSLLGGGWLLFVAGSSSGPAFSRIHEEIEASVRSRGFSKAGGRESCVHLCRPCVNLV